MDQISPGSSLAVIRSRSNLPAVFPQKLSLPAIARLTDDGVYDLFSELRWAANHGQPFCPRCGLAEKQYLYASRNIHVCGDCKYQYSVTSSTIFDSGKLPLRAYLVAISLFCASQRGLPSTQAAKLLGVQQKTAFILLHKIRESICNAMDALILSGIVEIDGAQFGGYRRYFNFVSKKYGRRMCSKNTANRAVLVAAIERGGRTVIASGNRESDSLVYMAEAISPTATLIADEAKAWDGLCALVDSMRVDHSYSYADGAVYTNNVESFWAGMRKMHSNHVHMSPQTIRAYAAELAWKRDFSTKTLTEKTMMIVSLCLCSPPSLKWRGYWQRRGSALLTQTNQ